MSAWKGQLGQRKEKEKEKNKTKTVFSNCPPLDGSDLKSCVGAYIEGDCMVADKSVEAKKKKKQKKRWKKAMVGNVWYIYIYLIILIYDWGMQGYLQE